ncbi:YdcF family protein [Caldimonas tepidiphila]|uniref:YdcF family protein n=1 Tax=Caldimonas tepidiphila TaxID=2315841 RepID=UPI000E5AAD63|nr:YdcF family protein [Caldimonas tepidiphila]
MLGRAVDLLLPLPLYLLGLLGWLSARSYWRPPGRRLHRLRPLLLAVTAWVWVVTMPVTGDWLHRRLEGPPVPPAERAVERDPRSLVIVLGSGQMRSGGGSPHPRLDVHGWERTVEGIALWKRTGGTLLFCGGPAGPGASLAGLMRQVALDMGVPPEAIRTVETSANTRQDLQHALELLAERPGPTWLVTSALHMPRAQAVARRLGLSVQSFPVDYRQIAEPTWRGWLPNNGGPQRLAAALHEVVGRLVYRLRGWSD